MQDTFKQSSSTELNGLAHAGGWAAIVMLGIMLAQVIVFIIWPPPVTVEGFFNLFEQ